MAKKTKKKEKYITERISKAGSVSYEICIRKNEQVFRKSIPVSDFDSPKQAFEYAVQLRDEKLVEISKGYTVSHTPTVRELYEATFDLFPVRMKTKIKHSYFFKYGIEKYADTPIDKLTPADVQMSINDYAKSHTHRQTIGLLAIWRRIFKACAMKRINIIDCTVLVKMPECAEEHPKKKDITEEDLEAFLDALLAYNTASKIGFYENRIVYYAIRVMQYCGLRPAETFALMKEDIHLLEGYISITKAAHSTQDSMLEIGKTKTKKSVRNVPIPSALKPYLTEALEFSKYDILFADYHGNLFSIDRINVLVCNIRKKAKVQFNLYMLRHQFSTDMMTQGIAPNIIRDLMGHESASMSLDYANSNEADRIEAINNRHFS